MENNRKMTIKKQLWELVDSKNDSIGNAYMKLEKLVKLFLEQYVQKQGKSIIHNFTDKYGFVKYDFYVPDGFDDFDGDTRIEIQAVSQKRITRAYFESIVPKYTLWEDDQYKYCVLIIPRSFSEQRRKEYETLGVGYNLVIWGIDELAALFDKEYDLYNSIYKNLDVTLIRSIINLIEDSEDENVEKYRTKSIEILQEEYKKDNLTLFLGAGVSSSAGIVAWDELISNLYIDVLEHEEDNNLKLSDIDKQKVVDEMRLKKDSPLIHARIIKGGLGDKFEDKIAEKLYNINGSVHSSRLLQQIGKLCAPPRGRIGIKAVITYNFDDLVEKTLDQFCVRYCSVYCDEIMPDTNELGIYHVHGFLPQNREGYEKLDNSLLVFSENTYHTLMLEPYHWANITQLNYLINSTCLFVGLSLSDPNLRRLLEVAAQKRKEVGARHYAIMKYDEFQCSVNNSNIRRFEKGYKKMLEQNYESLGVKVIWVNDYDEIPNILMQIGV